MAKKASLKASMKIHAVRKEYESVKRLYHRVGKATGFGRKAKEGSKALGEYVTVKREYRRAGRNLAKLTHKKPLK